jgi:hypothetical protein
MLMLSPAETAHSRRTSNLLSPPAPLDGFAAEELKARRDAVRAACRDGIVLVRGATEDEVPYGLAVRYGRRGDLLRNA